MLMSIMDDEEVEVAFEAVIIQTAMSPTMAKVVARALVTEEAIMALVARFVANQARKEKSEAAQQPIDLAPPSPPPFPDGSSFPDDKWNERKRKKYPRRKTKKSQHPHVQKTGVPGRGEGQSKQT